MTNERYTWYAFRSTRSSWLTLDRDCAVPSRGRPFGQNHHCRVSIGYEFLYWLKRASGATCPSALRSAGPRAAGGRFAPVLAHPARYALRTRRNGCLGLRKDRDTRSFSTAIAARSRRATPLTSEPPTRSSRVCTPPSGVKGATRRSAMASGHPGPRTPTSKRAGYRVGGSPLALAEARTPCAPPTTSARHFVHRSHEGRRARTGPPSLRNEKVRGSNPLSSTEKKTPSHQRQRRSDGVLSCPVICNGPRRVPPARGGSRGGREVRAVSRGPTATVRGRAPAPRPACARVRRCRRRCAARWAGPGRRGRRRASRRTSRQARRDIPRRSPG